MKTHKAVLLVRTPRQFYINRLASAAASLFLFTTSPLFAADSPTPADRKQPSKEAANRAKAQPFSDRNILLAIESEFQFDPAVDGRLVDVAVNDGIVTLTGKVDNLLARERGGGCSRDPWSAQRQQSDHGRADRAVRPGNPK